MESKLKHLDLIQGVVNRMANSSFLIKGWSITLVAAVLALSVDTTSEAKTAAIAMVPIIVFWILDGYYLYQERLFRGLYDDVRGKSEQEIDFSMNTSAFKGGTRTWRASTFSTTLIIFNIALIVMTVAVTFFVRRVP